MNSLKTKFLLAAIFLTTMGTGSYFFLATDLFNSDKIAYIYATDLNHSQSLARETRTRIESSIKTIQAIASNVSNNKYARAASQTQFDADSQLVHLSVFDSDKILTGTTLASSQPVWRRVKEPFYLPYWKSQKSKTGAQNSNDSLSDNEIYLKRAKAHFERLYAHMDQHTGRAFASEMVVHPPAKGAAAPTMLISLRFEGRNNLLAIAEISFNAIGAPFQMKKYERNFLANDFVGLVWPQDEDNGEKIQDRVGRFASRNLPSETREVVQTGRKRWIQTYTRIGIGDLVVGVERDKNQALLAAKRFVWRSIIFALLIICISAIAAVLFTTRLTRGLKDLREATRRIAKGNFSVAVPIRSKDELGVLAWSFNVMGQKISELLEETANKAKLEQDLETAMLVQKAFLPTELIEKPGISITASYQSADQCGGDWWGHFDLGDNQHLILVADAVGHGMPAALLTAMVHAAVAVEIQRHEAMLDGLDDVPKEMKPQLSPSQVLDTVNRLLASSMSGDNWTMTAYGALLDLDARTMVLANAGHNFPILMPKDDRDKRLRKKSRIRMLRQPGTPMGFDSKSVYTEKQMSLMPGDRLCFYTDGIFETGPSMDDQWGFKRFANAFEMSSHLSTEEAKDYIVRESEAYRAGNAPSDDITLVMVDIADEDEAQKAG